MASGAENRIPIKLQIEEKIKALKEWQPPRWLKITAVVLAILLVLVLFSTALVGALAFIGAHVASLGSLNSAITSPWKGLDYLMTAMGGPAVIIALGLMAYGVYAAVKGIKHTRLKTKLESNSIKEICVDGEKKSLIISSIDEMWDAACNKLRDHPEKNAVFLFYNNKTFTNGKTTINPNTCVGIYKDTVCEEYQMVAVNDAWELEDLFLPNMEIVTTL